MTIINVRLDATESSPGDVRGGRCTAVPGEASGSQQRWGAAGPEGVNGGGSLKAYSCGGNLYCL